MSVQELELVRDLMSTMCQDAPGRAISWNWRALHLWSVHALHLKSGWIATPMWMSGIDAVNTVSQATHAVAGSTMWRCVRRTTTSALDGQSSRLSVIRRTWIDWGSERKCWRSSTEHKQQRGCDVSTAQAAQRISPQDVTRKQRTPRAALQQVDVPNRVLCACRRVKAWNAHSLRKRPLNEMRQPAYLGMSREAIGGLIRGLAYAIFCKTYCGCGCRSASASPAGRPTFPDGGMSCSVVGLVHFRWSPVGKLCIVVLDALYIGRYTLVGTENLAPSRAVGASRW